MKTRFVVLACAVMALGLAMPALAQDPPATLTLAGTVASSSPTSLTIRADDGSTKTFLVDDRSSVPATLVRGARVNITYETSGDQMRAVSVAPSEASLPPATGTEATGDPNRTDPNRTDPSRPERLPATASPLPLIALLSVVALASGLALRRHLA